MRSHHSPARALLVLIVVLASFLSLSAATAVANVRAFDATTGAEDKGFVKLPPTTRPSLLVADGRRGVYVVGRLTTGGKLRIVHVLPDGTVDPAFRATVGPGSIFAGAVRGRELALIGAFRRIDGQRRRDIAVLDATTGRLRSWAPSLPSATRGQGLPHVVFTANRLVAASVGAVTAWTDGASKPIWVHRLPTGSHHDETPEIASWRGSILATAEGMLFSIRPGSGRAQIADRDFRWEDFANVGGRLFYGVESDYYVYGVHARPRCGQETANFSAGPVAGTTRTLFVSSGPVDVDPPAPPGAIYACSRDDREVPGFTPPRFPSPDQHVNAAAVVGTHLLVFTSRF